MRDPHEADTAGRPDPVSDAPPKPSHAASLVATVVLLATWVGLSLGADALAPVVAVVAERVEVGLGLDVLPGSTDDDADEQEGAG